MGRQARADKLVCVGAKIPLELSEALPEIARERGCRSVSSLIRELLEELASARERRDLRHDPDRPNSSR